MNNMLDAMITQFFIIAGATLRVVAGFLGNIFNKYIECCAKLKLQYLDLIDIISNEKTQFLNFEAGSIRKNFANRRRQFMVEQFKRILTFDADDTVQTKVEGFYEENRYKIGQFKAVLEAAKTFFAEPFTGAIKKQ